MKRKVIITIIFATPFLFLLSQYMFGMATRQMCLLLSLLYVPSLGFIYFKMKKYHLLLLFFFFLFTLPAMSIRPKIGLALGGGGAKGAATIGAIKVIEEAGIKVDYIAGTSIGAAIGGLYSAGLSLQEIEDLLFVQGVMDVLSLSRIEYELDRNLTLHDCEFIQNTRIPFRCVAVDADEMKEYVLSNGDMAHAIVASMAVPVVFRQVPWESIGLNDGGLLNNLPVDVVKKMGADIVIAIDLQQNDDDGLQIPSFGLGGIFDTIAEWSVTRPDKKKYRENVKSANIHIHPNLSGYNAASFGESNCETMKKRGEEEARKHWNELIKYRN